MKYKLIKSSTAREKRTRPITVRQILNQEDVPNLSVAIVNLGGKNKKVKNTISDSVYVVLNGKGFFYIEDEKIVVKKNDAVFIPRDTTYFDEGEMTLLVINSPKFDGSKVEYLI